MSLKAFHIAFITLSTALAVLVGLWSLGLGQSHGGAAHPALAVGAFAVGVGLPVYGVWFLKKMRGVSLL